MGTIHAQGKGTRLAKRSIARRHVLISLAVQRSTEMPIFLFNLEIIHTRTEVEIVLIPGVCSSDNCLLIFTLSFVILSAIFIYWLAIDETILIYLFKKMVYRVALEKALPVIYLNGPVRFMVAICMLSLQCLVTFKSLQSTDIQESVVVKA